MIEIINNPKFKKIYISGAITDMPNGNKFEFEKYENKFRVLGLEPINPHKLHTEEQIEKFTWHDFMKSDIKALVDCDIVAVINGWQKSKGANLEVHIARHLEIPIVNADTLIEIF